MKTVILAIVAASGIAAHAQGTIGHGTSADMYEFFRTPGSLFPDACLPSPAVAPPDSSPPPIRDCAIMAMPRPDACSQGATFIELFRQLAPDQTSIAPALPPIQGSLPTTSPGGRNMA